MSEGKALNCSGKASQHVLTWKSPQCLGVVFVKSSGVPAHPKGNTRSFIRDDQINQIAILRGGRDFQSKTLKWNKLVVWFLLQHCVFLEHYL